MPLDVAMAMPARAQVLTELLRMEDATRQYPFSRSDLYRRSAAGEIEILKIGCRSVIRRAELERLVAGLRRLHPPRPDAA